jgi:hypothetical protein
MRGVEEMEGPRQLPTQRATWFAITPNIQKSVRQSERNEARFEGILAVDCTC